MKIYLYSLCVVIGLCGSLGGKNKRKKTAAAPRPDISLQSFINTTVSQANPNLHVGIEIYSLTQNKLLYSNNEQKLFIPASNTKIITAAATLHHLGSHFKFETILATDQPINNGKVSGSLYLKGSGDPSLSDTNLESLVIALKKQGITHIQGTICVDATEFDEFPFAPGAFIDDIGAKDFPPVDTLTINSFNCGVNQRNYWQFLPRHYTAQLFMRLLKKHGIAYKGKAVFKKMPAQAHQLAVHYSAPLKELVATMMKYSDNLYADCFFKKLGAAKLGAPGTWKKGQEVIKQFLLSSLSISHDDLMIYDGAGASRYNSISPDHFTKILIWADKQPFAADFLAALPTSGVDGSIANRMRRIPGKVKAKTGNLYLSGASSLSGYVENRAKERFVFSIMINGIIPTASGKNYKHCIEDAIASFIATSRNLT
jgi:D-alanyl-D-alanine carboxypeptidase/D-alanyl-D-alanine-endopeptidase (penicillin-binding protein 4)